MSLSLREEHHLPYNSSKIRFKWLRAGTTKSMFTGYEWKPLEWRTAVCLSKPPKFWGYRLPGKLVPITTCVSILPENLHDHAFHFFIEAITPPSWDIQLGIYEVDGFVASGTFRNEKAETYRKARLLHVCKNSFRMEEIRIEAKMVARCLDNEADIERLQGSS